MSLARLMNQPLTVERRSAVGTDQYGNTVSGTHSSYETTGYLEQTEAQEVTVDRETYTSDWLAVLPAGSALDGSDRIVSGDDSFEVIGPPNRVWNPRRRAEGQVEARLRAVTG